MHLMKNATLIRTYNVTEFTRIINTLVSTAIITNDTVFFGYTSRLT